MYPVQARVAALQELQPYVPRVTTVECGPMSVGVLKPRVVRPRTLLETLARCTDDTHWCWPLGSQGDVLREDRLPVPRVFVIQCIVYTEAQRAACRRHYLKNTQKRLTANRKWRKKNRKYVLSMKRKYYQENRAALNVDNRRRKQAIKKQVFERYGKACACCGEKHSEFLCIDHLNGGGIKHRKKINTHGGTEFYAWLKRNGYPQGFRTLCHNCNMAIAMFEKCPHKLRLWKDS